MTTDETDTAHVLFSLALDRTLLFVDYRGRGRPWD